MNIIRLISLSAVVTTLLMAQKPLPGPAGGGGGVGVGASNVTATSVPAVTSLAINVSSLSLSNLNTLLVQCWSGTAAPYSPVTITSLNPATTSSVTANFTSTANVTCRANSNGGAGQTGATGATGASGLLSGTLAAIPATCTAGASLYQATDQPITTQIYACTATNTWTRAAYTQGTSSPGTCTVGQLFFDTDATAGSNLQLCTATNTWTTISGGGGSAGEPYDTGLLTAEDTLSIPLATHNRGTTPSVWCIDNSTGEYGTPQVLNPSYAGALTLNFSPVFTGHCYVGGTGATGAAGSGGGNYETLRLNSGSNETQRARFNFIEGAGVNITAVDDAGNNETDVTFELDAAVLTLNGVQSPTDKTFDVSNIFTIRDDRLTLQDSGDTSKQVVFQLSGLTGSTTRTFTFPDASGTFALTTSNVATATALFANGSNCSGSIPRGVDASGAAEGCADVDLTTEVTGVLPDANIASGITRTIASGTKALDTDAIASTACDTLSTTTATGAASTDTLMFTANADITAVTGYAPVTTGGLAVYAWLTTNTINWKICNPTSSSITPGAVTLNYRIVR